MHTIYEAHASLQVQDFSTMEAAKRWVEANSKDGGYVVTFIREYNGHDRSCAMTVRRNGAWGGVDIHR